MMLTRGFQVDFDRRRRAGTAATELAVVLPLLITLCLASVDFGRFAYAYIALGNATRVGSEYGATRRYDLANAAGWEQRLETAMRDDFSDVGGLDPTLLDIQVDVQSDSYQLNRITVVNSYPFSTVVAWPGIPQPINMQRSVVFRRFR